MRQPLGNQILKQMLIVVTVSIIVVTLAHIQSTISANRSRERAQIEKVYRLIADSSFPLTTPILLQMKQLSGAEFIVLDETGRAISKTNNELPLDLPIESALQTQTQESADYYYRPIHVADSSRLVDGKVVQVLLPRMSPQTVTWNASKTPLMMLAILLPFTFFISLALSRKLTLPLNKLREQADQFAQSGHLNPTQQPPKDDEIRRLSIAFTELAQKLEQRELQVRQTERLETLIQFGNGTAHHLRNAATGCRMAVELMPGQFPEIGESENYQVAIRQLKLMDNYIKKFLGESKAAQTQTSCGPTNVAAILEGVLQLIHPSAKHLDVEIVTDIQDAKQVMISQEDIEQLMNNLVGNAVTAASSRQAPGFQPLVHVGLFSDASRHLCLRVTDNGPGPPEEIKDRILDPFVTGSPEGTGLGLSIVNELATRTGSTLSWERSDGQTTFQFEFGPDCFGGDSAE